MGFQGGKAKGADFILKILNDPIFDNFDYVEPFCGYCHILRRVLNKQKYTASDASPLVVALMRGLQTKQPFPSITKEEYQFMKYNEGDATFQRAVAAFAYSYNGHAWRGYVGGKRYGRAQRDYVAEQRRYYEKLAENEVFQSADFTCRSYEDHCPENALVYCDPPYAASAPSAHYSAGNRYEKVDFDTHAFWNVMRQWSENNAVFVSEYNAPDDFVCIDSQSKRVLLNHRDRTQTNTECLFLHKDSKYLAHFS